MDDIKIADDGEGAFVWKQHYHAALLETDPTKLPRQITDAYAAINRRIQQLPSHSSCEEYSALMSALRFLRILEKEGSEHLEASS